MVGYLEVLAAVSIWAFFNGILVNGIKTSGVGVGTWTALVGIATFGITFIFSGNPLGGLAGHQLIALAGLGIAAALNNSCYYTALKISIPNAALFHYLAPLLVIFWVIFPIFYQPITGASMVALVIGFVGVAWIIGPNIRDGNKRLIILGFCSATFYSLEIVLSGLVSKKLNVSPDASAFTKLLFQALVMPIVGFMMPIVRIGPRESVKVQDNKEWPKILIGGALLYLSFVLYFAGAQTVSDLHRGVLGYIDRIGAILLGAWYFRQPITKNILIGGIFILGAGLIITFF